MSKRRLTAYGILLIVSVIWGIAGPVIKFTLNDFPPLIFLTYRFFLSTIFAFIVWHGMPSLPKSSKKQWHVFAYSVLVVPVTLGLLFLGFDKTTALDGTLITTLSPILMVIAAALFLRERVTRIEQIGIGIAFIGTLVTIFEPILRLHGASHGSVSGNTLILLSMVAETAGFLIAKISLRETISPFTLTGVSFVIGFLVITPIAIATHGFDTIILTILRAPLSAHLGVWYMAFLSGTLAYFLKIKAMKSIEVGEASLFSYLFPIWAAPLALYWLGETITSTFVIGATIIATGVIIAEYKRRTKTKIHRGKRRHTRR